MNRLIEYFYQKNSTFSPLHMSSVLLWAACSFYSAADFATELQTSILVETAKAETHSISEFEFGEGTIQSTRRDYLVFQGTGRVDFVKSSPSGGPLLEGDAVKSGELLAELDHRRNNASMLTARANLDNARSVHRKAKSDYDRAKRLQAGGAIAGSRFEQLKAAYEQALAAVQIAEARIDETQSGLAEKQLRAPFDGQVAFINISEGMYYSQQQFDPTSIESATRTAPLVIIDPTSFEIVVDLPIFSGNRVEAGQNAYLLGQETLAQLRFAHSTSLSSLQGYLTPAQILSVSPAVNPKDRSVRVRIKGDQTENLNLIDGDFVTTLIEVGRKENATVIPLNALITKNAKYYAYVVKNDGKAERRELSIGLFGFNTIEVLEGLKLGEQVVTKGKTRLKPGSPLKVVGIPKLDKEGSANE
ncbi:efflux RND transporter periplasmic adaptor subunit [Endozoicomonas arenosclerae]|uniref:efflux RND transporter periplasmic adaptor subunit n=1 Tax=Endozoicomonas arenosclerae TaxID=1633495 RepID=UPI000782C25D|nr:efflux RND transporter periplasmic adaptor subunit [Endozoicomonas arenosclerae]